MNDDLLISWNAVTTDIGGQPANVIGYKVFDMRVPASPVEVGDTPDTTLTLADYIDDPSQTYPVAVAAYNSVGVGPMSQTVVPGSPAPSVPSQVMGVTAVIIPK